jgi:CBS domain-containing membrane protein
MTNTKLRVRDLMRSEVVSLEVTDTLDLADDIMRLGRIRHMPVTSNGEVVGILSQRDLFRGAVSSVLGFRPAAERRWLGTIAVREVMSAPVVTVSPEAPIRDAVRLMLDKRIGCLPVVEKGALVGLLSETDCLQLLLELLAADDNGDDRSVLAS